LTVSSLTDVRAFAVRRSLFPATTLADASTPSVSSGGSIGPARAQDLILRPRVQGYRAGDLERHYPRCRSRKNFH
jgi:hypothetical protein